MSIANNSTPIILWAGLVGAFAIYWGSIKHFETTLKREDFREWEKLVLLQTGALRIAPRAIFYSFLLSGDFRCLNNMKIALAAAWTVIAAGIFGVSGGVVYWYYNLYLPYQK